MRFLLASILFTSACASDITQDDLDADPTPGSPEALAAVTITPIRGADRASEISVAEAKTLMNDHGVKYLGVYIGGPCDGGSGWTKAGVTAISHATGWKFAPIFVGQQASSICGHHTLTAAQGTADAKATAADMKAFGWDEHEAIPVFLDVEAGTYGTSPSAATAYTRAWVDEIHTLGYHPDVYSSPDALDAFHDKKLRIDGVWAASYFYSGFKSIVPADLDQMGGRYRHKNRSWQYAGNFDVSGVGYVDADTANMLLAPKPTGTNLAVVAHRVVPAACGELQPTEGLEAGESISSCDGSVTLALSETGTLALSANGHQVWSVATDGGTTAVLAEDGELAVFDADGDELFAAGTYGYPDAHVELHADGLQVLDDDGALLWSSAKGLIPQPLPSDIVPDAPPIGDQL